MKSSFTDLFIRRPVLALVVNLIILIAGFQAIRTLVVRQYPRSDNAAVTVMTVYVGASADLVRGFITTPLERAIAAADGIDYIESSSKLGLSTITIRLRLNYDPNKALAEISSKVDQVRNDLPPEAEVPIINVTSADSQFAAAYLRFSSDVLEANQITDYLVRVVQPRLAALEGVQRAEILGGRTFAMRIWLKPDRMAALCTNPAQVREALAANNFLSAIGRTKGALVQVNLTANTDLRSVREFQQLVIREQGGAVVRLSDIADVVLGAEDYDTDVSNLCAALRKGISGTVEVEILIDTNGHVAKARVVRSIPELDAAALLAGASSGSELIREVSESADRALRSGSTPVISRKDASGPLGTAVSLRRRNAACRRRLPMLGSPPSSVERSGVRRGNTFVMKKPSRYWICPCV